MIKKNRNRILYLTYDGLTDPLGQSQILPYIVGISKVGFSITIISFEKEENRSGKEQIETMLKSLDISWYPLKYTKTPPVISTLWDIYRLKRFGKKLHKKSNFNLIHCRSYVTSLVGNRFKEIYNIKFLFDMRGFWADERIDGGIWRLSNPVFRSIYSFFKRKEKDFITKADHIVSLTYAGKKIIEKKLAPNSHAPITVIPCCVDLDHFVSSDVTDIARGDLHIREDQFVLGYVGSIGTWYMLPEMLEFFKKLLEEKPDSIFLFVTKENPAFILKEANNKGIELDRIKIKSATRNEVPRYIMLFDWSIFFIRPAFSKQASSPTKQGEIMAMGIPIICNSSIGDTDGIVEKYQSGVIIDNFSDEGYSNGLKKMQRFKYRPTTLRKGCEEYFSLDKGIKSYNAIYEQLLIDHAE